MREKLTRMDRIDRIEKRFFLSCTSCPSLLIISAVTNPRPLAAGGSDLTLSLEFSRSPGDAVILAVVTRTAPHRAVRLVEFDGVDGARRALLERLLVAHASQFGARPGRHHVGEQYATGSRLVVAERTAHLEAVDVRRFGRLLHVHAELDDVEEELQEVLILAVAALHGEAEEGLAVLQGECRRERDARALARLYDVERILSRVCDEALCALTEAHARVSGDDRGNPSAARSHRDDPALFVRRFDRSRARVEAAREVVGRFHQRL